MKEIFLLGAGASIETGIPGTIDMTKHMLEKISSDKEFSRHSKILKFVIGGLLFQQGIKENNPYDGVSIEDLFNAINLLGERQSSELGPFVGSWHPQLNELDSGELSSYTYHGLLQSLKEALKNTEGSGGFSSVGGYVTSSLHGPHFWTLFPQAIREVMTSGNGHLFSATADIMIRKLIDMVTIASNEKVDHLIPLVKFAQKYDAPVVTLNYDNAIELAGKISGIKIDTGFQSWSTNGEFDFEQGHIPLIKLHGSIDWKLTDGITSQERPLPYKTIINIDPSKEDEKGFRPAVVFGGKNKLTAEGPFLSLLRAFENKLSKADQLTVIGYSFRDDHVNEFIGNWLNGKSVRKIKIVDLSINKQNEFMKSLELIEDKNRVQFIDKKRASEGIAEIVNSAKDGENESTK